MQVWVVLEHDQSSSLVHKLGSKIYLFTVGFPVGLVNFPLGPSETTFMYTYNYHKNIKNSLDMFKCLVTFKLILILEHTFMLETNTNIHMMTLLFSGGNKSMSIMHFLWNS